MRTVSCTLEGNILKAVGPPEALYKRVLLFWICGLSCCFSLLGCHIYTCNISPRKSSCHGGINCAFPPILILKQSVYARSRCDGLQHHSYFLQDLLLSPAYPIALCSLLHPTGEQKEPESRASSHIHVLMRLKGDPNHQQTKAL